MLSKRLREVRTALDLTQTQFGEALGTTRSVIGNYEYGRGKPKKPFLRLICTIYNVNSEWLINGTGEMFNPPFIPDEAEEDEALTLYTRLSPAFRRYALKQIKELLEVQDGGNDSED